MTRSWKFVLAVVGHYASEVTRAAMSEYQQKGNGLVVVSPTSKSTYLSKDYGAKHIFFRTISSTAVEAKNLAEYAKQKIKARKIAVFTSNGEYSRSLTQEFSQKFGQPQIIGPYNLDSNSIDRLASNDVKNADALAVFPNGQNEDSEDFDRAIKLINNYLNQDSNKKILGANSLFLWNTLNSYLNQDVRKKAVCRLIVNVDWFFKSGDKSSFTGKAASSDYWGGAVNYRTALANDAVRVLVEAWQPDASRLDIQEKLSSGQVFEDDGFGKIVTGDRKVSFSQKNGDRQETPEPILVTPVLSSTSNWELLFDRENAHCP